MIDIGNKGSGEFIKEMLQKVQIIIKIVIRKSTYSVPGRSKLGLNFGTFEVPTFLRSIPEV